MWVVLLCALVSQPLQVTAQVVINEVVAINNESLEDDNGNSPDWIEILNTGAEPVNLAHFGISDDPLDVFKENARSIQLCFSPGKMLWENSNG